MPNFQRVVPDGDNRERDVCGDCGFIAYENPKIVAGAVASFEDKILLCKRAIEPRSGYWTIPAGYIENHESPRNGAIREAKEEAVANIQVDQLLGMFTVKHLSQVQMIYRATLPDGKFAVGEETLEAELFAWDEIPWSDLAFPSVEWALERWKEVENQAAFTAFETTYTKQLDELS